MAAPTKHVLQASTARAHVTIRMAMATSATPVTQTAASVDTEVVVLVQVRDPACHAPTPCRPTPHTQARDPSTQTTADGSATQHSIRKMINVIVAPTSHAAQTSTAQVRVITRVAMATSATAVFLTARQVSIAVAALERVRDRARAAPTSQTTRHTRGKDPST